MDHSSHSIQPPFRHRLATHAGVLGVLLLASVVAGFVPLVNARALARTARRYLTTTVRRVLAAPRPEAARLVAGGRGRQMAAIRDRFAQFRATEDALRVVRERRAAHARTKAEIAAVGSSALGLLLIGLAAAFLARRVLVPLERITDATRRRRSGELGVRTGLRGRDELGVLARSFDAMTRTRERMSRELRESHDRFAQSFEHSPAGQVLVGLDGTILRVNTTLCRILDRERAELVGASLSELTHPDDREAAESERRRLLESDDQSFQIERRHLRRDGRWVPTLASVTLLRDADGKPLQYMTQLLDLTDAKEAAAGRQRESLGILAGGVAHDFNNLLMGILGNAELLGFDEALDERAQKRVEKIATAAQRASTLTRQMLAYSGGGRYEIGRVSVSELVGDLEPSLAALLSGEAALVLDLAPAIPPVDADAAHLRDVVTALVANAAEALPADGGTVTVTTRATGETVELRVADDGSGMDEATCSRIFEPFFTTKFTGRGLGLAGALGVVEAHGGAIAAESAPGCGTVVTIALPAAAAVPVLV